MSTVMQLSITMPDLAAKLADISSLLGENGVNLLALCVDEAEGAGVFRFIAGDPQKASNVLRSLGFPVKEERVLAAETPHHPGGLNAVLKPLQEAGVRVKYLYCVLATGKRTILIVGVDNTEVGVKALKRNWIDLYDDKLYQM